MSTIAAMIVEIGADVSGLMAGLGVARAEMAGFAELGTAALPAALALGAAGAAIGLGFKGAVETAAEFNGALEAVRGNTTMTDAGMAAMRETVLQLGAESNVPLQKLAEGFMHITNFGFSAADSTSILTAAMKSAASSGGDTAKTAEVLAAVMKEFSIPAAKAADTMDMVHTAAAEGNMTLEQFTSSFGQVSAIAAAAGVPLDQAAAAFSAMTRHGFDAAEAGTQVKDMIMHMINPSSEAKKALEQLGRASGTDLSNALSAPELHAKGLTGVLGELKAAMDKAGLSTEQQTSEWLKLLPNIRGGSAAFVLAGLGAGDYASILSDLHTKLGITDEAFARMKQQASFKWGVLGNQMQELGIVVGNILLPPLGLLVDGLIHVASFFHSLPTPILTVLTYVGVLASAVLLLSATFGVLMFVGPQLLLGFKAMSIGLAVARAGFLALAQGATLAAIRSVAAWAAAAAPVLMVVAAVVAAGATLAFAWQNDFLGIREIVSSVVDAIADKIAGLMDWLASHNLLGVQSNWREGWQKIKDDAAAGVQGIGAGIKAGLDGVASAVNPDIDKVTDDIGKHVGTGLSGAVIGAAEKAAQEAKDAADAVVKGFADAATGRKLEFELAHVDDETNLLGTKLDQAQAESALVGFKRQIEDLDRNAVDYAAKRLELDQQDAITRAKIAESALKANDEDLTYQQQLIKAQLIASRHGGPAVDRRAMHDELKDLHNQQIRMAPGLLTAEHNTTLANRAKEGTDLAASLGKTDLERQKLAIQEAMAPFEAAATFAKRVTEDAEAALKLEKDRFAIWEIYFEKDRLRAEIAAKAADADLLKAQHDTPANITNNVTVNVPSGDPEAVKDAVIEAVTQAAKDAASSGPVAVPGNLGGAGYTAD